MAMDSMMQSKEKKMVGTLTLGHKLVLGVMILAGGTLSVAAIALSMH